MEALHFLYLIDRIITPQLAIIEEGKGKGKFIHKPKKKNWRKKATKPKRKTGVKN